MFARAGREVVDAVVRSGAQDCAMPQFVRHTNDGDLTFNYVISGSGPRVLFLNGLWASIETFTGMIERLSARWEVLVMDPRGIGGSTIPDRAYTLADCADDVAALCDHVEWGPSPVVGLSFGGMVALEFALGHPERVTNLVLLATSAGGEAGSSYPLHELMALSSKKRNLEIAKLLDTRPPKRPRLRRRLKRALRVRWRRLRRVVARQPARQKHRAPTRGEILQVEARAAHDVCDRLHRIMVPTLVAAGRFDLLAPVANAEQMAVRMPNAEMRVYEGGHMFIVQDPAAVTEIDAFVTRG